MYPKCYLDARNILTLREHLANISGILRAGWVICGCSFQIYYCQYYNVGVFASLLFVKIKLIEWMAKLCFNRSTLVEWETKND